MMFVFGDRTGYSRLNAGLHRAVEEFDDTNARIPRGRIEIRLPTFPRHETITRTGDAHDFYLLSVRLGAYGTHPYAYQQG